MLPALGTLAYYMAVFLQPVQIHYNRSPQHSPVFESEFLCHRIQCTLKKIFLVQNRKMMTLKNFRKTSITKQLTGPLVPFEIFAALWETTFSYFFRVAITLIFLWTESCSCHISNTTCNGTITIVTPFTPETVNSAINDLSLDFVTVSRCFTDSFSILGSVSA